MIMLLKEPLELAEPNRMLMQTEAAQQTWTVVYEKRIVPEAVQASQQKGLLQAAILMGR